MCMHVCMCVCMRMCMYVSNNLHWYVLLCPDMTPTTLLDFIVMTLYAYIFILIKYSTLALLM